MRPRAGITRTVEDVSGKAVSVVAHGVSKEEEEDSSKTYGQVEGLELRRTQVSVCIHDQQRRQLAHLTKTEHPQKLEAQLTGQSGCATQGLWFSQSVSVAQDQLLRARCCSKQRRQSSSSRLATIRTQNFSSKLEAYRCANQVARQRVSAQSKGLCRSR